MNSSLPGSSVHGIFQARILKWVAISFSRRSSPPRDQTWVSCIASRFFTNWSTWEALTYSYFLIKICLVASLLYFVMIIMSYVLFIVPVCDIFYVVIWFFALLFKKLYLGKVFLLCFSGCFWSYKFYNAFIPFILFKFKEKPKQFTQFSYLLPLATTSLCSLCKLVLFLFLFINIVAVGTIPFFSYGWIIFHCIHMP